MGFFSNNDIATLFDRISKSKRAKEYGLVCKVCLSTGARISEANNLRLPQIMQIMQIMQHKNTLLDTKSKRSRTVPITKKLYSELITFERTGEKDKLFKNCLHGIAYIVKQTPWFCKNPWSQRHQNDDRFSRYWSLLDNTSKTEES